MTQLLDMLQLKIFIYFIFIFFLKLFPRTHACAGAALPARHVTAPYRLCSIQVPLLAWTPTAVLSNVSHDKHCVKVSELYARPFPLICFVFTPDYCSTPCAFVLVTQLPSFFFFLKQSSLSFHLLPIRLSSHIRLIILETGRANLEIAAFTPLSFIWIPSSLSILPLQ